jgi:hypothetical protein
MRRLHLWEFGDQQWLRGLLREVYMDCLNRIIKKSRQYQQAYVPFCQWIDKVRAAGCHSKGDCDSAAVLDLGSGGGGPIDTLIESARGNHIHLPRIILSDVHPSIAHFQRLQQKYGPEQIGFLSDSVSAAQVPPHALRLRSCFSVFHHFPSDLARAIVADATSPGSDGIFIIKSFSRSIKFLIGILLLSLPVNMLLAFSAKERFWWNVLFW